MTNSQLPVTDLPPLALPGRPPNPLSLLGLPFPAGLGSAASALQCQSALLPPNHSPKLPGEKKAPKRKLP